MPAPGPFDTPRRGQRAEGANLPTIRQYIITEKFSPRNRNGGERSVFPGGGGGGVETAENLCYTIYFNR